jgi:hypothetical protein
MNLFIVSNDIEVNAKYLDDRRLIKGILENCQMLSTGINLNGGQAPYKSTHPNHPVSIWVRETRANFQYVIDLTYAMTWEYKERFQKVHACYFILNQICKQKHLIPEGKQTPFVNCARNAAQGLDFTHISDVRLAYREYLRQKWKLDEAKGYYHTARKK